MTSKRLNCQAVVDLINTHTGESYRLGQKKGKLYLYLLGGKNEMISTIETENRMLFWLRGYFKAKTEAE